MVRPGAMFSARAAGQPNPQDRRPRIRSISRDGARRCHLRRRRQRNIMKVRNELHRDDPHPSAAAHRDWRKLYQCLVELKLQPPARAPATRTAIVHVIKCRLK